MELTIANTAIRQLDGLFSLNDLHRAAGGEKRHRPNYWLALAQTKELIAELENSGPPPESAVYRPIEEIFACVNPETGLDAGIPASVDESSAGIPAVVDESSAGIPALVTINGGLNRGTFVAWELVYAYAMWISPAFHIQVIRAYHAIVIEQKQQIRMIEEMLDIGGSMLKPGKGNHNAVMCRMIRWAEQAVGRSSSIFDEDESW